MNDAHFDSIRDLRRWPTRRLEDRLALLSAYVTYWHGAPENELAVESLQLPSFLPAPVCWLYQTIVTRNDEPLKTNYGGWTHGDPIMSYHWIKRPSELLIDSHGIVEFLNETQGVYQCGTLSSADDPEVLIREAGSDNWNKQADLLSDFLLFTVISEQTMQGPITASGLFASDEFSAIVNDLLRVQIGTVLSRGTHCASIYHGEGLAIVAGANSDGTIGAFAAAKTHASAALKALPDWEFYHGEEA